MTTDTPSSRDEEIPTPRTNSIVIKNENLPPYEAYCVMIDHAGTLEREIVSLSAEREKERPVANRDVPTLFPTLQSEIKSLRATLVERDNQLAGLKFSLSEQGITDLEQSRDNLVQEIRRKDAQLLAAQTVNGKLREAILTMLETVSMRRLKNYRESAEFLKRRGWTAIPFTPHGAPESVIAHPSHPYQKWEKPGFNKLITDAALKMESKLEMDALAKLVALSPDPTLLDEVVELAEMAETESQFTLTKLGATVSTGGLIQLRDKAIALLSRLRQSTRETEEKV